jgi:hypothetical protein
MSKNAQRIEQPFLLTTKYSEREKFLFLIAFDLMQ